MPHNGAALLRKVPKKKQLSELKYEYFMACQLEHLVAINKGHGSQQEMYFSQRDFYIARTFIFPASALINLSSSSSPTDTLLLSACLPHHRCAFESVAR